MVLAQVLPLSNSSNAHLFHGTDPHIPWVGTSFNTLTIMDNKLSKQLQAWLATPEAQRDINAGYLLTLQYTQNKILADNFRRVPRKYMPHVDYQLRKFLTIAVANKEHSDVENMMVAEKKIANDLRLNPPMKGVVTKARAEKSEIERGRGKRPDHDSLPAEIQALWVENADIKRRIINAHNRLCILSETRDGTVCPDGDRYPYVKEVLELSAQLHKNYLEYDNYQASK